MDTRTRPSLSSIFLATVLTVAGAGCSANSSHQSRVDRAMSEINSRNYDEASAILSEEHAARPQDKRIAFLYAQAELGLAKFEMFDFVRAIMSAQDPDRRVDLSVTPACSDEAIADLKGADIRCVLFRIMQHLPDVNDSHFVKARSLLLENFPDASGAPAEVNFLIAFVDMSSALATARTVLLKSNAHHLAIDPEGRVSEEQFHFLVHALKGVWTDATDSLRRLKYSYTKLKKLVYGENGRPIVKIGRRELNVENMVESNQLLLFFADVVRDQMTSINSEGNRVFGEALSRLNASLGDVVGRFSREYLRVGSGGPEALVVMWRFDRALQTIFLRSAGKSDGIAGADPVELIWNHPPKIFTGLKDAVKGAWETESRRPLLDYYAETQSDWKALADNLDHWDAWLQKDLNRTQRDALTETIREFVQSDPRFTLPPENLLDERFSQWETDVVAALRDKFTRVLSGAEPVPALNTLTPEQANRGLFVVAESLDWIEKNLVNRN